MRRITYYKSQYFQVDDTRGQTRHYFHLMNRCVNRQIAGDKVKVKRRDRNEGTNDIRRRGEVVRQREQQPISNVC